jgi:hypothetical protein
MDQCVRAAEAMFNEPLPRPIISPLKRKSLALEDPPEFAAKRQAVASPSELSPSTFPPPSAGIQQGFQSAAAAGTPPGPVHQRPNGNSPTHSAPLSAAPPSAISYVSSTTAYNPAPAGRRPRGRPPKSAQQTWQVSTYQPIAPSTASPQPHSPGIQGQVNSPRQPSAPGLPDPQVKRKMLPEIAPRPSTGPSASGESANLSPALPGPDYQHWPEESMRRGDYYQVQSADHTLRDRPQSYPPILPRPQSPYPPRDMPRTQSTEPRRYTATPPAGTSGSPRKPSQDASSEPIKT